MINLRVGLGIAAGALLFGAGWAARGEKTRVVDRPVTQVVTQVQHDVQTQTQVVDHVVNHTVTQVVTKVVHDKAGNVTTTQTTTKDDTKDKTADKNTEKESTIVAKSVETVAAPASLPSYSLELQWQPRLDQAAYMPTGAEIGYRVAGPAWVTAGFDWRDHSGLVGLRVEF